MKIEGHDPCRLCNELHPSMLLSRLAGLCSDCAAQLAESATETVRAAAERVLVRDGGRSYVVKRPLTPRRDPSKRAHHNRELRAADAAALRQLKAMYPAMYALLRTNERRNRGLTPVSVEHPAVTASQLEADLADLEQ